MRKTVIFTAVGLIVALVVSLFVLHQVKSNKLDDLVASIQEQDTNYTPPAKEAEATQRYKEMSKKYPKFFDGGGLQELDFMARTELGADHQNRSSHAGQERQAEVDELWNEFQLVIGAKERLNKYIEARDSIIEKDLQVQMGYDLEKMELFDEAVKYCTEDTTIGEYLAKANGTSEYQRQLGLVLYNAQENLCPKL